MNNIKQNVKALFTWQYYKDGLTGWTSATRNYWYFGLILLTILTFGQLVLTGEAFTQFTALSWLGGMIGFTTTLAITNGKRINGILGIVSAIMLSIVAIHMGFYAEVFMQVGYILTLDIPVVLFGNEWNKAEVKRFKDDKSGKWQAGLVLIIAFAILYTFNTWLNGTAPFIDTLTASVGFVGAFLMLRKYSEQYFFWALGGLLSIYLWSIGFIHHCGNLTLPFIYVLYLGNNAIGMFDPNSPWYLFKNKK